MKPFTLSRAIAALCAFAVGTQSIGVRADALSDDTTEINTQLPSGKPDGIDAATLRTVLTDLTRTALTQYTGYIWPVANGGTGTSTPSLVAGSNVTISGTWPNQTVSATGGGGATPGGTSGQFQTNNGSGGFGAIANPLPVTNGGTGTATPSLVAGSNITVTGSWPNQTITAAGGGGSGYTQEIDVRSRGAICDGTGHPLNTVYASLAAAQVDYPFVTSLTQQLDYAALKKSSNDAFGADGSEHAGSNASNLALFIPAGSCQLGNDTWTIRNAVGIKIRGAGRTATKLQSNNTVLAFDGLWYSQIDGIEFDTLTNTGVVTLDIDGNVPGHAYSTRGVQGVTIKDVLVTAGGSTYAFAMCRQGGGGGQCSENQYLDLHLSNASVAAYYQNGYNAIDNNWFGGDVQNFQKYGAFLIAGSIGFYKVSFESTVGYTQIVNDGWDIDASSAGAGDTITVYGGRSESLRFYHGGGSQPADIRNVNHQAAALNTWSSGAVPLNYMVKATGADGFQHAYRVTTAGTTGGSAPTWPATGTVTDGSAVWTMTPYTVVDVSSGEVSMRTSSFEPSATVQAPDTRNLKTAEVTAAAYTIGKQDNLVLVDPTAQPVTITLTETANNANSMGHIVTVKRATSGTNAVTVSWPGGSKVLPGGSLDAATFTYAGGSFSGPAWYQIAYLALAP